MSQHTNVNLLLGEHALTNAPCTEVADGQNCIPQHYLTFNHTIESVEALVLDIEFSERYPVFVSQDEGGVFIQVGIIGFDNYQDTTKQAKHKIVYGRKWRVEPQLPTSEIIQTVFLALKKAREHEIRELFRYDAHNATTTPFNNHHDLPLLARLGDDLAATESHQDTTGFFKQLAYRLQKLTYDNVFFDLLNVEQRPTGQFLVELQIVEEHSAYSLKELQQSKYLSFLLDELDVNLACHQLMAQLIALSDRYVDETFKYQGIARFSWHMDMDKIAQVSAKTRRLHAQIDNDHFVEQWRNSNYSTDLTRVPQLKTKALADKVSALLNEFGDLNGMYPVFD